MKHDDRDLKKNTETTDTQCEGTNGIDKATQSQGEKLLHQQNLATLAQELWAEQHPEKSMNPDEVLASLRPNLPVKDCMEIRERALQAQLREKAMQAQTAVEDVLQAAERRLETRSQQAKNTYEAEMARLAQAQEAKKAEREAKSRAFLKILCERMAIIGLGLMLVMTTVLVAGSGLYRMVYHTELVARQEALVDTLLPFIEVLGGEKEQGVFYTKNFYQEYAVQLPVTVGDLPQRQMTMEKAESYLSSHGWHITETRLTGNHPELIAEKEGMEFALNTASQAGPHSHLYASLVWLTFPDVSFPGVILHTMYTTPLEQWSSFGMGFWILGFLFFLGANGVAFMALPKKDRHCGWGLRHIRGVRWAVGLALFLNIMGFLWLYAYST